MEFTRLAVVAAMFVAISSFSGPAQAEPAASGSAPTSASAPVSSPVPVVTSPKAPLETSRKVTPQPPSAGNVPTAQKGETAERPEKKDVTRKEPDAKDAVPAKEETEVVQEEVSAIEKAFNGEAAGIEKMASQTALNGGLRQFGYGFFQKAAENSSPLTDIPVGPDYVIGPGDSIILTSWGSLEGSYVLEVNRSGEVMLPRVGAVRLWGVPFGKVQELVKSSLSRVFRDFQINITMGRLRLMKVFVIGEVTTPGAYNLSSLSTVVNALAAAGGPLKSGSLRGIEVRRGKEVTKVDLYDFLIKGDKGPDLRLEAGDTIFVPLISRTLAISGDVRRAGIYELSSETNLEQAIELAGGLPPTGFLSRMQILRITPHDRKTVADLTLDPKMTGKDIAAAAREIPVQDRDIVRVFPIDATLRGYVRLQGSVVRPGEYAFRPGMKVSDMLQEENLLPEYSRKYCEITRVIRPDMHQEKLFINPEKARLNDPQHNLQLEEFDVVKVFSRWEMEEIPTVHISGEVQRPGEYRLLDRMTLRDLVLQAGNLKSSAFLKNAEISRTTTTSGTVTTHPLNIILEEAMQGNPQHNIILQSMDEVIIRKIPNWNEEIDRYVSIQGEVYFPGVYPVYHGEKLSSVIKRAGGFTRNAYLRGAKFTRRSVQENQQRRMNEVIARTEADIDKKQGQLASVVTSREELESLKSSLEALQRNLRTLKAAKAEGRVVMQLAALDEFAGGPYDIEIEAGDALHVPAKINAVNIFGEVHNPTTLIPLEGKDVSYYLSKAGGTTSSADNDEMYLIRADGTIVSRQQTTSFLFYDGFLRTRIEPGDSLVVPQRLERTAWLREIKDITTILSQIAVTAGVILAAGL